MEVFPPKCEEKPELLVGMPLGQYHCLDCGAMVIAGLPHPQLCKPCNDSIPNAETMEAIKEGKPKDEEAQTSQVD